jgi:phosphate transport system substrate-binding protein
MNRSLFILSFLSPLAAIGADLGSLPEYRAPKAPLYGDLRVFDPGHAPELLQRWMNDFNKYNKAAWFYNPGGTSCAIGTLYAGINDIAFVPRKAFPAEIEAYREAKGHDPLDIVVGRGAFATNDLTPAVVVFVNERNPISKLSLKQLDGIFGAQRTGSLRGSTWTAATARDSRGDIRTWGQLGLAGEWADKPIRVIGYDLVNNGFAYTFQQKVMGGADNWNPTLEEYPLGEPGRYEAGAVRKAGGRAVVAAVSADPFAIALANLAFGKGAPVKPIAIGSENGGPYVEPTLENCENRTYPLTNSIHLYANLTGTDRDRLVKEFMRFVLSREGQQDLVEAGGGYLPLNRAEMAAELKKLE